MQQRQILLDQACLGLGENPLEILAAERLEFDADGQASLQFRQKVRWLGGMEGARRDKQDMIGLHRAMLGRNRRAFDERQQIALHALAADIGALPFGAGANLVDFIEKDDAVIFDGIDGVLDDLILIEKLVAFFGQKQLMTGLHGGAARLGASAESLAQHVGKIDDAGRGARHSGNIEAGNAAAVAHLNFDFALVEFTGPQFLLERVARRLRSVGADERIDDARFGIELRLGLDTFAPRRLHHGDARFEKIPDHLVDVTADVAHLGELRGFDLDERRIGELGKPAGDLGLADAGGPNHQDVFRHHLFAQRSLQLLAPPAVAQRDGDGALGVILADDVPVQFGNDLPG